MAILSFYIYPDYVLTREGFFVAMRATGGVEKDICKQGNESCSGNPNSNFRRFIKFNFFRSAQVWGVHVWRVNMPCSGRTARGFGQDTEGGATGRAGYRSCAAA